MRIGHLADEKTQGNYFIKYGPGVIFSNIVPGLDVNFINPKYTEDNPYKPTVLTAEAGNNPIYEVILANKYANLNPPTFENFVQAIFDTMDEEFDSNAKAATEIVLIVDTVDKDCAQMQIRYKDEIIYVDTEEDNDDLGDYEAIKVIDAITTFLTDNTNNAGGWYTLGITWKTAENSFFSCSYNEFLSSYKQNQHGIKDTIDKLLWWRGFCAGWYTKGLKVGHANLIASYAESLPKTKINLYNYRSALDRGPSSYAYLVSDKKVIPQQVGKYALIYAGNNSLEVMIKSPQISYTGETRVSISYELREMISSWYKALRAIALVGLLSVLVYVGIRILIASTGQEKAKYKKMIGDWLAAICILFVLQYIMVFIMEIVQKISDMLSANVIGSNGEDILISKVRNSVGHSDEFKLIFTNILMYLTLVIYTVMFTIQYLKRVVYVGFLTMIAPLIALTYPLDKIRDGQAQAFSMWLREYIFNALMQPMHLLLYVMFVGSAINLAVSNPLYAIVAIGFMLPAEKFFRKMFGFDKAESSSQLGAAAGGALIMNAINKMGSMGGKQGGSKGKGTAGGESGENSTPRYASTPESASEGMPEGSPGGSPGVTPGSAGGTTPVATSGAVTGAPVATSSSRRFRKIKGVAKLGGLGLLKAAKGTAKLTSRAAGAALLGTVGLAAGIATGNYGDAVKNGLIGAAAGYSAGKGVFNSAENLASGLKSGTARSY